MTVEYTKTIWKNNSAPYLNEDNLNNIENGVEACANEINAHTSDGDIHFTSTERTKLAAIEPGAQVNPSATELLESIKTVDGPNSGLDADLLDGYSGSDYARIGSTVALAALNLNALTKYTAGGNYPFKFALSGPSIRMNSNDVHEYWGNALWFADKRFTLTKSGHVINESRAFRTGDSFSQIWNDEGDVVYEVTSSGFQIDSSVTNQRLYLQAHGTLTCHLKVELKRKDDTWVTLADEDINLVGKEYWFSPSFGTVVTYPTDFSLKGFRWTISNLVQSTTYVRQLGLYSSVGQGASPCIEQIGGGFYGDVNWYSGVPKVSGHNVWHAGNDGAGSGLDADLLDGQHASAFATSGHTHTSSQVGLGNVVNERQVVAKVGGKNLWVQSSEPTAIEVGDIWIQTGGTTTLKVWSGSAWV